MKKIAALVIALLMLYTLSVPAFASFVVSPSNHFAPSLESFEAATQDDCELSIVITAYKDRDTLPDLEKGMIETAYGDISGTADISSLNSGLVDSANKLGIKTTDLAVSDLFDIRLVGCEEHSHGPYEIKLRSNTLGKFVNLVHYTGTEWEIIENAKVEDNILSFTVDSFSPFAVVVNTDESSSPTGDSNAVLYILLILASVTGIAFISVKAAKSR